MYDEGAMASTGAGVLVIGGIGFTLDWLLAIAVGLILVGALTYRVVKKKQARV
jgi:hypothetical protein